mmetsp:Transcript_11423/g.11434  ORF Transcript_11423/g.11434 Transcript_11423/m.11434 type:complete len:108 (-) Transcript_11423:163-486(-)
MHSKESIENSLHLPLLKTQDSDIFSYEKLQDQVTFSFLLEEEQRLPKKSLTKPLLDLHLREHLEVELSEGNLTARCPKAPKLQPRKISAKTMLLGDNPFVLPPSGFQ